MMITKAEQIYLYHNVFFNFLLLQIQPSLPHILLLLATKKMPVLRVAISWLSLLVDDEMEINNEQILF